MCKRVLIAEHFLHVDAEAKDAPLQNSLNICTRNSDFGMRKRCVIVMKYALVLR
jgi:hypothetical protein